MIRQESSGRYTVTVGVDDEKRKASHGPHGRHAFTVVGDVTLTSGSYFEPHYCTMDQPHLWTVQESANVW